jgi:hypothetical protein
MGIAMNISTFGTYLNQKNLIDFELFSLENWKIGIKRMK